MATQVARQGRHRQLYEDNRRLVSGCIPYRMRRRYEDCECSIEECLEVLMVSSPSRHDFVFPKGGWENDETIHEAACREALEEAGVRGMLNPTPLGVWEFRSKSRQAINSLEGGCRGQMFALEVTEELETWPEQKSHCRKWLDVREAFKVCRYDWMKEALRAFIDRMDRDRKQLMTNNPMIRDSNVTLNAAMLPERQVAKATSTNRAIISTAIIAIAFAFVAP